MNILNIFLGHFINSKTLNFITYVNEYYINDYKNKVILIL